MDQKFTTINIANKRYNLRPQPTERNQKYTMTQAGQQSTNKQILNPHVHEMRNVREGIKNMVIKEARHNQMSLISYTRKRHYCH